MVLESSRVGLLDLYETGPMGAPEWMGGSDRPAAVALRRYRPGMDVGPNRDPHARIELTVQGGYEERCASVDRVGRPGRAFYRPPDTVVTGRVSSAGLVEFALVIPTGPGSVMRDPSGHPAITPLASRALLEFLHADDAARLSIDGLVAEVGELLAGVGRHEDRRPGWLGRVVERLRDGWGEAPALAELAAIAGVHPAHMAREFRRRLGCSPGQYLRLVRLERGTAELASTSRPIARIAADHGFADQSHFGRHFLRAFRASPGAVRRGFREARRAPSGALAQPA
jgi:AraC family transcriptional regulator